MRKHIFTRLKTLLTAARVTLYTRRTSAAMPKMALEPVGRRGLPAALHEFDDWMFDADQGLNAPTAGVRQDLAREMSVLSASLGGLRSVLDLVSGVTPFPVDALTQRPCEMTGAVTVASLHHDADLFDGEVLPLPPSQDTVIGDEAHFLFDDVPHYSPARLLHAAAA